MLLLCAYATEQVWNRGLHMGGGLSDAWMFYALPPRSMGVGLRFLGVMDMGATGSVPVITADNRHWVMGGVAGIQ